MWVFLVVLWNVWRVLWNARVFEGYWLRAFSKPNFEQLTKLNLKGESQCGYRCGYGCGYGPVRKKVKICKVQIHTNRWQMRIQLWMSTSQCLGKLWRKPSHHLKSGTAFCVVWIGNRQSSELWLLFLFVFFSLFFFSLSDFSFFFLLLFEQTQKLARTRDVQNRRSKMGEL